MEMKLVHALEDAPCRSAAEKMDIRVLSRVAPCSM